MHKITSFLSKYFPWIILLFILLLTQFIYLVVAGVPVDNIWYGLFLNLLICAIFLCFLFYQYHKKLHDITEQEKMVQSGNYPKMHEEDGDYQLYQQIIEELEKQNRECRNEQSKLVTDMKDYYSMWIHQIKTPIAALQLLLQVNSTSENDELRQLCQDCQKELFSIDQYTNMALQYQKINTTGNDLHLTKVSLDEVIRDSIRKYAKQMIHKRIAMRYEGTQEVVISDKKWLEIVIEQVLSNAIKYTNSGEIRIQVSEITNADHTKVLLAIEDTGIGIHEDDLPRIFEKGYTGYNGHENKTSTGIGLYLCQKMLTLLCHDISIESKTGVGTKVMIIFNTKIS